jgi:hypothetical protein
MLIFNLDPMPFGPGWSRQTTPMVQDGPECENAMRAAEILEILALVQDGPGIYNYYDEILEKLHVIEQRLNSGNLNRTRS